MKPVSTRRTALALILCLLVPILAGCSKPAENPGGQTARELRDQKKGTNQ